MAEKLQIKINKSESPFRRRFRRLVRNPMAVIGFILVVTIVTACLAAPLLTDCDPNFIDMKLRYAEPSPEHPLGCDQSGRDILARLLYGGRVSLKIGFISAICANLLGIILGSISGFFGGIVDAVLVYIREIICCFPQTILLLVLFGIVDQMEWIESRVPIMIGVFICTGWPGAFGWLRGRMMSLKKETFVESLRANGVSSASIMFRHLVPNCLSVVIFTLAGSVSGYILSEAGLSFLGWGVEQGVPTWGNMLNAAQNDVIFKLHPSLWILPGLCILFISLGFNFFGDGLRDAYDVTEG